MGPRPSSGGGRRSLLVGLEPRVCIASYVLVAAYGVWLLLAPFERTPHAELWVAAALSLDNLAAGVALAASGGALFAVAVVALTSCALAAIGFCAGEACERTCLALLASAASRCSPSPSPKELEADEERRARLPHPSAGSAYPGARPPLAARPRKIATPSAIMTPAARSRERPLRF